MRHQPFASGERVASTFRPVPGEDAQHKLLHTFSACQQEHGGSDIQKGQLRVNMSTQIYISELLEVFETFRQHMITVSTSLVTHAMSEYFVSHCSLTHV